MSLRKVTGLIVGQAIGCVCKFRFVKSVIVGLCVGLAGGGTQAVLLSD